MRIPSSMPLPAPGHGSLHALTAVTDAHPQPFASSAAPDPSASRAAEVDVLIVGGGVCGTALLFELARYTDLSQIGRAHV